MYSSSNDTFFNFSKEKRVWAPCWETFTHFKITKHAHAFTRWRQRPAVHNFSTHVMLHCEPAEEVWGPYPGEDGEEGEGDGCSSSVPSLPQGVVLKLGHLPLVGQEAESYKPHEGPEHWEDTQVRERCENVSSDNKTLKCLYDLLTQTLATVIILIHIIT